jgi:hypothetical protein
MGRHLEPSTYSCSECLLPRTHISMHPLQAWKRMPIEVSFETTVDDQDLSKRVIETLQSFTAKLHSTWKDFVYSTPRPRDLSPILNFASKSCLDPNVTTYVTAYIKIHSEPEPEYYGHVPRQPAMQGLSFSLGARCLDRNWDINDFYQTIPEHKVIARPHGTF